MEINEAVTALASLAQPARLQIFRLLVKAGAQGMCAGDLSRELAIPKNTLSFHLKELAIARLITSERSGRSIVYYLRAEGIRQLMQFLTEDCCSGRPDLCFPHFRSPLGEDLTLQGKKLAAGNKVQNILFLCNHNSARSQMAEALLVALGDSRFLPFSAGLEPRPLSKGAVQAMMEIGIDISAQRSKSIDEILGRMVIHHTIFLCSEASEPDCPKLYPFANQCHRWRIPAPATLAQERGSEVQAFREVRDLINDHLREWVAQVENAA